MGKNSVDAGNCYLGDTERVNELLQFKCNETKIFLVSSEVLLHSLL